MANNRRGGQGYDDDGYGGGFDDPNDDGEENVEATRAMDVVDDFAPPTEGVRAAPPPPPPPGRPQRARPGPRPAPPPSPAYDDDEEEEEEATRMLDAMDLDLSVPVSTQPATVEPVVELRIISGPDRGKSHPVCIGDHLVGRGLDCGIVLADPAVSRKHFRLVRQGDVVEAVDMGGANGTNINGNRISRHRMAPGDQIEVGTTVLEVHIEGVDVPHGTPAANRFRQEVQASGGAQQQAPAGKSNIALFIGLAAVGFVVLVGGGLAAWLVLGGDGDNSAEVEDEGGGDELVKLISKAKELIDDREWAEAVDKLKAARKIKRDDAEVKGLLAKAQDELDSAEAIEDGQALVKKDEYAAAFDRFKEVPNTSELYAEAQEELSAAHDAFFAERLKAAKAAMDEGEKKTALRALDEILAIDKKHAQAVAMRSTVEAGEDSEGDDVAKDKLVREAAGAGSATGQNAKSLFNTAFSAYHKRKWSAAQQALNNVIDGSFGKGDKTKASEYIKAIKDVAGSMGFAETASSPIKQARAYQKAYNADRKVDGHFGPVLVKKLTGAYVVAGKNAFKRRRFAKAAEAAREAMNYDPENLGAMDLEEKCIGQAAGMLEKAREHLKKRNHATARDLARQVSLILPALDPRAAEAREIAKKATEAQVSGDDED